jgi:DNA-binding response OmpR family regulator
VRWVRLLERGGDDVIVKPFSYPELCARIAVVLRRTLPREPRPVLSAGPVRIDLRDRRVTVDKRAGGALRGRVPTAVSPGRRALASVDESQL